MRINGTKQSQNQSHYYNHKSMNPYHHSITEENTMTPDSFMESPSTQRSQSISIQPKRDRRPSFSYTLSHEDQISRSAVHMYDNATWRMYYRIMNERKRRAVVAKQLGLRPGDGSHDQNHDHHSTEKELISQSSPRISNPSSSSSSSSSSPLEEGEGTSFEEDLIRHPHSLSEDSLHEEGIFQMEL